MIFKSSFKILSVLLCMLPESAVRRGRGFHTQPCHTHRMLEWKWSVNILGDRWNIWYILSSWKGRFVTRGASFKYFEKGDWVHFKENADLRSQLWVQTQVLVNKKELHALKWFAYVNPPESSERLTEMSSQISSKTYHVFLKYRKISLIRIMKFPIYNVHFW